MNEEVSLFSFATAEKVEYLVLGAVQTPDQSQGQVMP